jgi:hypothetical protein
MRARYSWGRVSILYRAEPPRLKYPAQTSACSVENTDLGLQILVYALAVIDKKWGSLAERMSLDELGTWTPAKIATARIKGCPYSIGLWGVLRSATSVNPTG